ncbi:unnamed protein product, partial [Sphacelaria rigidula]
QVKDAGRVPDLSRMLREGLPYLSRNEATEMQLALAVSVYAHSRSRHDRHNYRVKAGVEVCLQLGRLGMGTEALLAAILSDVLRPETISQQTQGFGRAPVTLEDIREGFGANVASLVAGLEHVTCVEETAHRVMRGKPRGPLEDDLYGLQRNVSARTDKLGEVNTLAQGVERGVPGLGVGSVKRRSLRDASALEQAEKLRNLIVSEAADWQVLTLRLATQLESLKRSMTGVGLLFSRRQLARDALLVHGPLAHRLGVHQLRNELESAAFRRLFPEQFQEVRRATQDRSSVYETVLEYTKDTLARALEACPGFANQVS